MRKTQILEQRMEEMQEPEKKDALKWALEKLEGLITLEDLDKDCGPCRLKNLCGYPEDTVPCLCEDSRLQKVAAERYLQLAAEAGCQDKLGICETVVARLYASGEIGGSDF